MRDTTGSAAEPADRYRFDGGGVSWPGLFPGLPHSITSSARASSVGGTVRPRALAGLRLMTNSYFVGPCTDRSAGLSPLRMRPAYRPIRWYAPAILGP